MSKAKTLLHTPENCPKLRATTPRLYTLEQIKAAFWRGFCGCGEVYFGDTMTDNNVTARKKDANERTQAEWDGFLRELQKELDE